MFKKIWGKLSKRELEAFRSALLGTTSIDELSNHAVSDRRE